jgi:hypothetical protein
VESAGEEDFVRLAGTIDCQSEIAFHEPAELVLEAGSTSKQAGGTNARTRFVENGQRNIVNVVEGAVVIRGPGTETLFLVDLRRSLGIREGTAPLPPGRLSSSRW